MADCSTFDLWCQGTSAAGGAINSVVGGVAGNAIDQLAQAVADAVGKVVKSLATFWVHVDTPNLATSVGGTTPSDPVAFVQGSLFTYMSLAVVASILFAGAKMCWEQRFEPAKQLAASLLGYVVLSGCGLAAISLAVSAGDSFAVWIIDESVKSGDFGENLTKTLALTGGPAGLGPIVAIVFGLVAVLASAAQIVLMVLRGFMLVIVAGILPFSVAATNTEWGRAWSRRVWSWTIGFLLYKPAAAIIYATAFQLIGSSSGGAGDDIVGVLTGLTMMIAALVALPALIRFVAPVAGSVAGGGSGGAATAAAGLVPTGAMILSSSSTVKSTEIRGGGASVSPRGASAIEAPRPAAAGAATTASTGGVAAAAAAASAASSAVNGVTERASGNGGGEKS